MASKAFFLICLSAFLNVFAASALGINTPLLDEYDYIVVGGGPAGLTVANRISEDSSVTVLVLEAGPADHGEAHVDIPVFMGTGVGTQYDWNMSTVPQTYLDGTPRAIPQGHALGGATVINGMLWNRGGQGDYNDWEALGNPGWSWDDLLPYFMRSETYTPPASQQVDQQYYIEPDMAIHGLTGPVNVSYPNWQYNETIPLYQALSALGVPTAEDVNDGTAGITYLPLDLDPVSQTRSTARRAYYDTAASRPNLYVSTGQVVTRVLFENQQENGARTGATPSTRPRLSGGGAQATNSSCNGPDLRAIGVEYAADSAAPRLNITARREVILSAGSIHSPQLLQLSGIGPEALLSGLGIPVLNNLVGVGENLQDHYMVDMYAPYNTTEYILPTRLTTDPAWNASAAAEYYANQTGPWCLGSPDGDAFPSLPSIANGDTSIADGAASQNPGEYLASGLDPTIVAGYAAQQALMVNALRDEDRAVYELLNNNAGTLTSSTMRPFSRGSVQITTTDPFTLPAVDPRYGSNPVDLQVLLATLHFNEQILAQPAMASLGPVLTVPHVGASDDSLMQTIRSSIRTEGHPSCTCPMIPRELGGVVDPNLLVYGTANLRIVDASIFPLVPAAHLMAVVYGVAEKAADIIRSAPVNLDSCGPASNGTSPNRSPTAPTGYPLPTPTSQSSSNSSTSGLAPVGSEAATKSTANASSLSSLVSSAVSSARAATTSSSSSASGAGSSLGGSSASAGAASVTSAAMPSVVTVTKYVAPNGPSTEESTTTMTETLTPTSAGAPASTSTCGCGSEPGDTWDHDWVVKKARSDFSKLFGFVEPFFVAGN